MEQGFIKLHRSILNWEWWQDENTRNVFLWLLLNANWEDSRFQGHIISKGSLVTSYPKIAENLNISERNARTAIKHLKMTGEVTVKVTRRFSIVTITNWAKYQCTESTSDSLNDSLNGSQVSVKRQSSDSIKEYKNIRNKEEKKTGKEIYHNYQHGNYDFAALERETREPKRQHYDFEAIDKEIREK